MIINIKLFIYKSLLSIIPVVFFPHFLVAQKNIDKLLIDSINNCLLKATGFHGYLYSEYTNTIDYENYTIHFEIGAGGPGKAGNTLGSSIFLGNVKGWGWNIKEFGGIRTRCLEIWSNVFSQKFPSVNDKYVAVNWGRRYHWSDFGPDEDFNIPQATFSFYYINEILTPEFKNKLEYFMRKLILTNSKQ